MPIILLQYCYSDSLDPLRCRPNPPASAPTYSENDSPDASPGAQTSASPGASPERQTGAPSSGPAEHQTSASTEHPPGASLESCADDPDDPPVQSKCQAATVNVESPKTGDTGAAPVWTSDIGDAVGRSAHLSSANVMALLRPWEAPAGFLWPYTERKCAGRLRRNYLGPQHFRGKYQSFCYSSAKGGLFLRGLCAVRHTRGGGNRLETARTDASDQLPRPDERE